MRNGVYVDSKNLLLYYVNDYHQAQIIESNFKKINTIVILIEIERISTFYELIDLVSSWIEDNPGSKIYLYKSIDRRDIYNKLNARGFKIEWKSNY